MFDVGFSELLIIAVVALIVLGPERLPHAARFAGLWVRRARAQWHSVRAELERELEVERFKQDLDAASGGLDAARASVAAPMRELEQTLREAEVEAEVEVEPPAPRDDGAPQTQDPRP